jgi:hypothetical protein
MAAQLNATPVPREPLLQVPVLFHAKGEADCLNPLPLVSAARSRRQELTTRAHQRIAWMFPYVIRHNRSEVAASSYPAAAGGRRPRKKVHGPGASEPSATPRAGRVD